MGDQAELENLARAALVKVGATGETAEYYSALAVVGQVVWKHAVMRQIRRHKSHCRQNIRRLWQAFQEVARSLLTVELPSGLVSLHRGGQWLV
jgi:IS1 family transposase